MATAVQRWGPLAAVLLLAFGVRVAALVGVERIVAGTPGRLCLIAGDAEGYWELARRMTRGEDYELFDPPRRVLRMPGLPAIIAGLQLLGGGHVWVVRLGLVLIGTAACGLVFGLGRELVDETVGLWAALATAVSPALVVFSPLLLSETAFAAAITASLWGLAVLFRSESGVPLLSRPRFSSALPESREEHCWPKAASSGTRKICVAALCGVLIAVATYIRPTWLPVAGLAVLGIVIASPRCRSNWLAAVVLAVSCAAAMSPWVIRNYRVTGHVVVTTLWSGPSLYDGLHPGATGDSEMSFFDNDNLLATMTEYEMNAEYRRRAWQFAAEQPAEALRLAVVKQLRYWNLWPNAPQFDGPLPRFVMILATVPLYVGSVLGFLGGMRRNDWRLLIVTAGPVLFFAGLHLLFVGSLRYRLPAECPLWILAAAGWRDWLRRPAATRS